MADKKNENSEGEFPGYPHYPASEDIMNTKDAKRVEADVENLSRSKQVIPKIADNSATSPQWENEITSLDDGDDNGEKSVITDADITEDDIIALGERDAGYSTVVKMESDDLDIPGAEEDDANEEIGEEDEENNYYSLGGDAHENLEEDRGIDS